MRRLLLTLGTVWLTAAVVIAAAGGGPGSAQPVRWVGRDLGGFGGSYSGWASDVNERGQIVGSVTARNATGVGGAHRTAFLWQDGRLRDLGVHPPGLLWSAAVAINERGQVLGVSQNFDDKGVTLAARVWLWQAAHVRTILTTSTDVSGLALNDRGQVVGNVGIGPDSAFFWGNGRLTRIGGPGTVVRGLNNRGQVVGYRGANGSTGARAFVWQAGKMTDLGTLGGRISEAYAINDRGQIVGWSESRRTARQGVVARSHAFLWEAGRMTDLGTLGGPISEAYGINDRGDVIGSAAIGKQNRGSFIEHVFFWHDDTMTDIEPPALDLHLGELDNGSGPIALNNQGQALTYRYCCGGPAFGFVSEGGSTTRLGPLSAKGWSMPADINDHGLVVGTARVSSGEDHPALWQRQSG